MYLQLRTMVISPLLQDISVQELTVVLVPMVVIPLNVEELEVYVLRIVDIVLMVSVDVRPDK
jgi:hypothetical protein